MKLSIALTLLVLQGCLAGCFMEPVPARKLFGFSNPSTEATYQRDQHGAVKVKTKIPTDFVGTVDLKKNVETGEVELHIQAASTASTVVEAEGKRITEQVAAVMALDQARAQASTRMVIDAATAITGQVLTAIAPLLVPKTPKPDDGTNTKEELLRELLDLLKNRPPVVQP